MSKIHLAFFLFALFGCHLCQNGTDKPTSTITTVAPTTNATTTTVVPTTKPPVPTTTPKPTPPPTPKPTTPTPTPAPTTISGNVTDNNFTCIRYEFTVHFNIKYKNNHNDTKVALIQLPLNSKQDKVRNGTCTSAKESFSLLHDDALNFTMIFGKNENSVYLDSINLLVKYDNTSFPDIQKDLLNQTHNYNLTGLTPNFNVDKTHSYVCANVTVPKSDEGEVQVVFSSLKLQAFIEKDKSGEFSAEHNCQSEINDIVPIAVGAALTGLVVIVMVAYFIGRRRSRRLAYQSV